jgi:cytochrome c55X
MPRWLVTGTLCGLLVAGPGLSVTTASPAVTRERQRALVSLVRQDCGSCHGLTLKGGLGPALLPDNLRGKSPEGLQQVILDGIPETAMPPWRGLLTEAEAAWIVGALQKGFPDDR